MIKINIQEDINGNWRHVYRGYYACGPKLDQILNYAIAVKNVKSKNRNKEYRIVLDHYGDKEYEGKHREKD